METRSKEFWDFLIKITCMFIFYPIIWIAHVYALFSPAVRRHLLSYELDGNRKSMLVIDVISVATIAGVPGLIYLTEFRGDTGKPLYLLGLFLCLLGFGYISLVFMRDLKMQCCK